MLQRMSIIYLSIIEAKIMGANFYFSKLVQMERHARTWNFFIGQLYALER